MGLHMTPRSHRTDTKKVPVVDRSGWPRDGRGVGRMGRGIRGEEGNKCERLRGIRREFRGGSFSSSLGPFSCETGHAWHGVDFILTHFSPCFIACSALLSLSISRCSPQVRRRRKISRIFVRNSLLDASRCITAIGIIIRNSKMLINVIFSLPGILLETSIRDTFQFASRRWRDVAVKKLRKINHGKSKENRELGLNRTRVRELFLCL